MSLNSIKGNLLTYLLFVLGPVPGLEGQVLGFEAQVLGPALNPLKGRGVNWLHFAIQV